MLKGFPQNGPESALAGRRRRGRRGGWRAEIHRQGSGYAVEARGIHVWEESLREARWALEWLEPALPADAIRARRSRRGDA